MFKFMKNSNASVSGRVISKTGNSYVVRDVHGRVHNVETKFSYKVGDKLVIRDGKVLRKSAQLSNVKHFNV